MINVSAFELNYQYVVRIAPIGWQDTLVGLEREFIKPSFAVEFADNCLNNSQYNDDYVELLDTKDVYDNRLAVERLAAAEGRSTGVRTLESSLRKWMLVLLNWVFENQSLFDDSLSVVEELYAEFDYPAEIEGFVRYMPATFPDRGSKLLNEEKLKSLWSEYLDNTKLAFKESTL